MKGGERLKARQGSDRFLTWLQETKGLEVRALSLTRNGGLVRRKVWQRMVPEENLRGNELWSGQEKGRTEVLNVIFLALYSLGWLGA